jgi:hypothetical protein
MNVSLGDPVVQAALTTTGSLGVVGARFVLDGGPSQSRFSLVEHPIVAGTGRSFLRPGASWPQQDPAEQSGDLTDRPASWAVRWHAE